MALKAGSNQPDLAAILREAQTLMIQDLLDKLKGGTITHQEMAILQKELRSNGITVNMDDDEDAETERRVDRIATDLPSFPETTTEATYESLTDGQWVMHNWLNAKLTGPEVLDPLPDDYDTLDRWLERNEAVMVAAGVSVL